MEIEDEQSSWLEVEEEQAEGEKKGEVEEVEQSEEENKEEAEHSEIEAKHPQTESEHSEAEARQSKQEEEMGQQVGSPPQDPVGEEELAAILANMGEYGQPSTPSYLHDKPQEEDTSEKPHAEEAEEGNLPVHDEKETGDTEREQSVPKAPEEIPEEVGI